MVHVLFICGRYSGRYSGRAASVCLVDVLFLAWFLCIAGVARATSGSEAPPPQFPGGMVKDSIYATADGYRGLADRVKSVQTTEYAAILNEYDAYEQGHPENTVSPLEKCRFIRVFADSDDVPVDTASQDADRCDESLRAAQFEHDGAIQLYLLEELRGAAALTQAEKLLPEAYPWTQPMRARLYEALADGHRANQPELADREIESALQLDPLSPRRLDLVRRYVRLGARRRALQLLFDTPSAAWSILPIVESAQLLYDLGEPKEAVKLLQAYRANAQMPKGRLLLARALDATGDVTSARVAYTEALRTEYGARISQAAYFQFELRHGSLSQAESAYGRLRASKPVGDPWGRYRLAFLVRHPTARWGYQDTVGVLRFLTGLAALAVLPVLIVAPVHYRSLAKRLKGWTPKEEVWGLKTAWYVLALLFVVPLLAMYVVSYGTFLAAVSRFASTSVSASVDTENLGLMLICQTMLLALGTIPMLRKVDCRVLFLGHASLRSVATRVAAALLILGLVAMVYGYVVRAYPHHAALGDVTTRAIQAVQAQFGTWVAFIVVAALVPLIEETLFRGILLKSLSRYLTFRWAAVIQALVFAGLHESGQAFPYLMVLGLLAAWLVRRTGSILAATCFHGINNAVVLMILLGTASSVNAGM